MGCSSPGSGDHDLDHVVARHDDVVIAAAGLQLGEQGLVAVIAVHGHLDAGVLLELGQQLGREIVGPVVEEQLFFPRPWPGRAAVTQPAAIAASRAAHSVSFCAILPSFLSMLLVRRARPTPGPPLQRARLAQAWL